MTCEKNTLRRGREYPEPLQSNEGGEMRVGAKKEETLPSDHVKGQKPTKRKKSLGEGKKTSDVFTVFPTGTNSRQGGYNYKTIATRRGGRS